MPCNNLRENPVFYLFVQFFFPQIFSSRLICRVHRVLVLVHLKEGHISQKNSIFYRLKFNQMCSEKLQMFGVFCDVYWRIIKKIPLLKIQHTILPPFGFFCVLAVNVKWIIPRKTSRWVTVSMETYSGNQSGTANWKQKFEIYFFFFFLFSTN